MSNKDFALAANVIRGLAMDGVQAANSGHPGMPMGAADYATVLFLKYMNSNPSDPAWPDRDRFVLSAGHGAMLIYSLLHLSGYDLTLDELKAFRQWGSRTPGHPEYGHTPGVETTTGPLGQGCATAVGLALAERMLAERFNTPDMTLVDHRTYVICGDGDLMEGISHEAFSLAGHLKLSKLTLIYDSNRISIEGSTDLACSDDVRKRFEGYGWNVIDIDGHNFEQIDSALAAAGQEKTRPTVIVARSHIATAARICTTLPRPMASRSVPMRSRPPRRISACQRISPFMFHRRYTPCLNSANAKVPRKLPHGVKPSLPTR